MKAYLNYRPTSSPNTPFIRHVEFANSISVHKAEAVLLAFWGGWLNLLLGTFALYSFPPPLFASVLSRGHGRSWSIETNEIIGSLTYMG